MSLILILIALLNSVMTVLLFRSTCDHFEIQPKMRFDGYGIYFVHQYSITRCARECFLRSECLSITFNTTNNQCKTHSSDGLIHPSRVIASNTSSYVGMHSWTLTSGLEGCASRPCPLRTRCIPIKNNNYTCIISECDRGVSISHSWGWNWRPVGRTKTLKCAPDYYLNGTVITSTCLSNGTWSYTDEIDAVCLPKPESTTLGYNTTAPTEMSNTTGVP
ncbi:uncharacterized protein [Argopecten irradians]|uniref:uncharacterized protein n=1 Tax=Argopecten irradians TaxID=31199 RepID=UPI00371279A0